MTILGTAAREPTFETVAGGCPVVIADRTPERVRRLARSFDVAYCSSRGAYADPVVSPLLGLPPGVPHVPLDMTLPAPSGATRKLIFVEMYVGDRAIAWIDDALEMDCEVWERTREAPTLVICTDSREGLNADHEEALLTFAGGLHASA